MADIETRRIAEALTSDGFELINVTIEYPYISGLPKKAMSRVNKYYEHQAKMLMRHVKKHVLPSAAADFAAATERSAAFTPYVISESFTVAYSSDEILSLYRDIKMRVGHHRSTERFGETWCVSTGWFLELDSFFPQGTNYRRLLIKNIRKLAQVQEDSGSGRYFEHYHRLIRREFSPYNFYITGDGIAIFYSEGQIAEKSAGMPVFLAAK